MNKSIDAVLFDLDGTLLDTAPDFVFALNNLLSDKGKPTKEASEIRPAVSKGSAGLIELGFSIDQKHQSFEPLRNELLDLYSSNLTRFTRPFLGIEDVLEQLADKNIAWGIVTNKPAWLTLPLLEHMKLNPPPGIVVAGDTLTKSKPHPEPIFHALEKLNVQSSHCLFIGDSEFDAQAGKKAGVTTIIAEYGYISNKNDARSWEADIYIEDPMDILRYV